MSHLVTLTLLENDLTALQAQAKGNVSYVIRETINDYDLASVRKLVRSDRAVSKSFRLEDDFYAKLKRDADDLGVTVSALIRAIIESKLNKN